VVTGTLTVVPVGKEVTVDGDADPLKMKEVEVVVGNVNDADEDTDGKAEETVVGIVNDADEDADGKAEDTVVGIVNDADEDADGKADETVVGIVNDADEYVEEMGKTVVGTPLETGQLVSVTVTVTV
jgi:hypothetical protein